MKKLFNYLGAGLALILLITGCKESEKHFLTNQDYRTKVHEQFLQRKALAANREQALFSVLEKEGLDLERKEALEFLYAYMPLCDLADYDGEFFLRQVNSSFEAREYFSWGKTIPEDIFRHFVLVYRVNNEYLDTARQVFFEELKDKVKNLSMAEAALEVNHWCHEKVTYRGTDGRTSAPLALVRTSWGRCGEESTFAAAALRAVGIPARQCYTPRWVHTDDNHAWVEVWIDGKWHYIGACEPEPELDVAWFTGPAKRAMMVHTNVFGLYTGPEEKNLETTLYSKINLLENYAQTRQVKIKVVDKQDQPVEGAAVRFKVYNYAELYPIAEVKSDKNGEASILSGMGDLVIWASKGNQFGYAKNSPDMDVLTVKLDKEPGAAYEETYVLVPPSEQPIKELSKEKIAKNASRLAYEDSVRNTYMNTFPKQENVNIVAKELKLDEAKMWKYVQLSQGNWTEIQSFIKQEKENPYLFPFLASLLEKDLRDTPAKYLTDHLQAGQSFGWTGKFTEEQIAGAILSPRIALELIQPWRSFFQQELGKGKNVQSIIDYIKQNIQIKDEENYYNCYITPRGAYELKISDKRSRNVLFVAMCRSIGIPARVEQATGKPQYLEDNDWKDVQFGASDSQPDNNPKGTLVLDNLPTNLVKPGYYTHFTIARFKDGDFESLDFENDPAVSSFPSRLNLDAGYYRLMTGSRANDGSITVRTEYFELKEKETKNVKVILPEVIGKIQLKGSVDMNTIVFFQDNTKKTLKELAMGKGLIICFADPDKEPTKHVLQDIPAQQADLESWGGGIIFMVPDDKLSSAFDASVFKNLPSQTIWNVDEKRSLLNAVAGSLKIDFQNNFPLMVYISNNGGILYYSQGYRIGIGEDLLKTIKLEKESFEK